MSMMSPSGETSRSTKAEYSRTHIRAPWEAGMSGIHLQKGIGNIFILSFSPKIAKKV